MGKLGGLGEVKERGRGRVDEKRASSHIYIYTYIYIYTHIYKILYNNNILNILITNVAQMLLIFFGQLLRELIQHSEIKNIC